MYLPTIYITEVMQQFQILFLEYKNALFRTAFWTVLLLIPVIAVLYIIEQCIEARNAKKVIKREADKIKRFFIQDNNNLLGKLQHLMIKMTGQPRAVRRVVVFYDVENGMKNLPIIRKKPGSGQRGHGNGGYSGASDMYTVHM